MIHFNYKGNKYTIVSWAQACNMMEIKKDNGTIGRFIKYDGRLTIKDFLSKLAKVNFM